MSDKRRNSRERPRNQDAVPRGLLQAKPKPKPKTGVGNGGRNSREPTASPRPNASASRPSSSRPSSSRPTNSTGSPLRSAAADAGSSLHRSRRLPTLPNGEEGAASRGDTSSKRILEAFQKFDENGDGNISAEELGTVLRKITPEGEEFGDEGIRLLLQAVDKNGDGAIQYEEFVRWITGDEEERPEVPTVQRRRLSIARHAVRGCFGHEHFIGWKRGSIKDGGYDVGADVGEGGFGQVSVATHKTTGSRVAVKTVAKRRMQAEALQRETEMMKQLDHPNIVRLIEVHEDKKYYYLVMELCSGGELFDYIVENDTVREREVAAVMKQILSAIRYMHGQGIAHRDLKPENFLLQAKNCIDVVKVIDFGLACRISAENPMKTKAGSAYYVAPEVLSGKYDQACDLWSCGVVMYILFSGEPPFCGDNDEATIRLVKRGRYNMPEDVFGLVSQDGKDLIDGLLTLDPKRRLTAEQAMAHDWISKLAPRASGAPMEARHLRNMQAFCGRSKLKKAALHAVALLLSDDHIRELKDLFSRLDENCDGVVTFDEFEKGVRGLRLDTAVDLREIMDGIDVDWNGRIDYTEFLAATLDKRHYQQEAACWSAFHAFDTDGSGTISKRELGKVLHNTDVEAWMGSEQVMTALEEFDRDNDGEINFEEFFTMMRSPCASGAGRARLEDS